MLSSQKHKLLSNPQIKSFFFKPFLSHNCVNPTLTTITKRFKSIKADKKKRDKKFDEKSISKIKQSESKTNTIKRAAFSKPSAEKVDKAQLLRRAEALRAAIESQLSQVGKNDPSLLTALVPYIDVLQQLELHAELEHLLMWCMEIIERNPEIDTLHPAVQQTTGVFPSKIELMLLLSMTRLSLNREEQAAMLLRQACRKAKENPYNASQKIQKLCLSSQYQVLDRYVLLLTQTHQSEQTVQRAAQDAITELEIVAGLKPLANETKESSTNKKKTTTSAASAPTPSNVTNNSATVATPPSSTFLTNHPQAFEWDELHQLVDGIWKTAHRLKQLGKHANSLVLLDNLQKVTEAINKTLVSAPQLSKETVSKWKLTHNIVEWSKALFEAQDAYQMGTNLEEIKPKIQSIIESQITAAKSGEMDYPHASTFYGALHLFATVHYHQNNTAGCIDYLNEKKTNNDDVDVFIEMILSTLYRYSNKAKAATESLQSARTKCYEAVNQKHPNHVFLDILCHVMVGCHVSLVLNEPYEAWKVLSTAIDETRRCETASKNLEFADQIPFASSTLVILINQMVFIPSAQYNTVEDQLQDTIEKMGSTLITDPCGYQHAAGICLGDVCHKQNRHDESAEWYLFALITSEQLSEFSPLIPGLCKKLANSLELLQKKLEEQKTNVKLVEPELGEVRYMYGSDVPTPQLFLSKEIKVRAKTGVKNDLEHIVLV